MSPNLGTCQFIHSDFTKVLHSIGTRFTDACSWNFKDLSAQGHGQGCWGQYQGQACLFETKAKDFTCRNVLEDSWGQRHVLDDSITDCKQLRYVNSCTGSTLLLEMLSAPGQGSAASFWYRIRGNRTWKLRLLVKERYGSFPPYQRTKQRRSRCPLRCVGRPECQLYVWRVP